MNQASEYKISCQFDGTYPGRWYDRQSPSTAGGVEKPAILHEALECPEKLCPLRTLLLPLLPFLTFSSIFYYLEKEKLLCFLICCLQAYSHSVRQRKLRFFGKQHDSPPLFSREFSGALKDSLQTLSLGGSLGRGGDATLGKDLKYVSTHFCMKDLLTELVLKPKYLFWSLK